MRKRQQQYTEIDIPYWYLFVCNNIENIFSCSNRIRIITENLHKEGKLWCSFLCKWNIISNLQNLQIAQQLLIWVAKHEHWVRVHFELFEILIVYILFPPQYNWNIVESGVKHNKPNQIYINFIFFVQNLNRFVDCNWHLNAGWIVLKNQKKITKNSNWELCRSKILYSMTVIHHARTLTALILFYSV